MDIIKISKENLLLSLPEFKYDNTWIAGGAIRDAVLKEKISDIDIFGVSKDKLDLFIETNLKGCKKVYDSDILKTFILNGEKVQVIYRDYLSVQHCLDSFDYTLCQFAFDGKDILCNSQSLLDIFRKKITIHKIDPKFAVNSLRRLQKYIQKGYSICDGGLKRIVETIRETEQSDIDSQFEFYPDGKARIIRFD
jgi:hypothetical protein